MIKQLLKVIFVVLAGLTVLCIGLAAVSAIANRSLPQNSLVTGRLSDLEKARLSEVIHLRQSLGEKAWPGWGALDIPIIVYNEAYAFLVGYPNPPGGWLKMPQQELRGGAWEVVPEDSFEGQVYYRQRVVDPERTPENFTVLVGDRWAATMETKEYMQVHFYAEFAQELPSIVRAVFPYRVFWNQLMGNTETYIGGLEHEAFHAFQGTRAADRLTQAEFANRNGDRYPWDDQTLAGGWQEELDLLVRAVRADSEAETAELARQFLGVRDRRRAAAGLDAGLVDYERQREWLEGLAKYAELSLVRQAGAAPGYSYAQGLDADPDFKRYQKVEQYWSGQIDEVRRRAGSEGESRFYYSGMAQAVLLDRLLPGWKDRALEPGVWLEDLLRQAVGLS